MPATGQSPGSMGGVYRGKTQEKKMAINERKAPLSGVDPQRASGTTT